MPWKATCIMDERLEFIADCLRKEEPMSALCAAYGISRKTGYKWLERYLADPAQGLLDRSRAPHQCDWRLDEAIASRIVALRRRHPHWGPRKLLAILSRENPDVDWPAASTAGELLRRAGLSEPRRRRRSAIVRQAPFLEVSAPNDVWCADFKGWFRTSDGRRCDPLTISDAHTRYLLECRIVEPTRAGARPRFERAFRTFGLPKAIRTDNGPPFASIGAGGLSRLSVEWVKLGIKLEPIEPGEPQQNGRHERMHRTLKQETANPPARSPQQQQARFDRFRRIYNKERPHEALGQQPPAQHYTPSIRPYPDRIPEPWYGPDHAVRRVRPTGEIKWAGELVFIGEALAGEPVGIAETQAGDWIVRFSTIDLALIERRTNKIRRFTAARPGRREATPKPQNL